jgi:hypothetical protein
VTSDEGVSSVKQAAVARPHADAIPAVVREEKGALSSADRETAAATIPVAVVIGSPLAPYPPARPQIEVAIARQAEPPGAQTATPVATASLDTPVAPQGTKVAEQAAARVADARREVGTEVATDVGAGGFLRSLKEIGEKVATTLGSVVRSGGKKADPPVGETNVPQASRQATPSEEHKPAMPQTGTTSVEAAAEPKQGHVDARNRDGIGSAATTAVVPPSKREKASAAQPPRKPRPIPKQAADRRPTVTYLSGPDRGTSQSRRIP